MPRPVSSLICHWKVARHGLLRAQQQQLCDCHGCLAEYVWPTSDAGAGAAVPAQARHRSCFVNAVELSCTNTPNRRSRRVIPRLSLCACRGVSLATHGNTLGSPLNVTSHWGSEITLVCRAAFRLSAHEGPRRSYVISAPASCSRETDSRSLLLIGLSIGSADARSVVFAGNDKAIAVLSALHGAARACPLRRG